MRAAALAISLVAACSSPAKPPAPVAHVPAPASVDAPPPSPTDDEKLAAIQKAMNELDEAVQGCWAAAATERFDIEGDVKAQIDIGASAASTQATVIDDTTRNPKLTACVQKVLVAYPWAPPLRGQSIQLPFRFRAPDGQSVIDRKLVTWVGQGKTRIAVLLDDLNTGNDAASMFEIAVQAGGSTGLRIAERDEVWLFLGPATVGGQGSRPVAAGDMAFVPKGGAREIAAGTTDLHAVLIMVPGGREGAARAGALPTPEATAVRSARVGATVLPASGAKQYGPVKLFAEPAITGDKAFSAEILELPAGKTVPEHVHATETELLYVLAGAGTITVAGVALPVTPTSVLQIPPNTKHSFTASADFKALQLYTPAGPEQRFKK